MTVDERIKKAIKNKEQVTIYHNNETGQWQWSVTLKSMPDFWVDSFKTKKEAINFCKKHKLPIVPIE